MKKKNLPVKFGIYFLSVFILNFIAFLTESVIREVIAFIWSTAIKQLLLRFNGGPRREKHPGKYNFADLLKRYIIFLSIRWSHILMYIDAFHCAHLVQFMDHEKKLIS